MDERDGARVRTDINATPTSHAPTNQSHPDQPVTPQPTGHFPTDRSPRLAADPRDRPTGLFTVVGSALPSRTRLSDTRRCHTNQLEHQQRYQQESQQPSGFS